MEEELSNNVNTETGLPNRELNINDVLNNKKVDIKKMIKDGFDNGNPNYSLLLYIHEQQVRERRSKFSMVILSCVSFFKYLFAMIISLIFIGFSFYIFIENSSNGSLVNFFISVDTLIVIFWVLSVKEGIHRANKERVDQMNNNSYQNLITNDQK